MMKPNRRGLSQVLWIVVAIILFLGLGFLGLKGLGFIGATQETIQGVGKEFIYQPTGNFPQVCNDWQASPEKYTTAYILGGAFRPSVTASAKTQGAKFECCWKDLQVAAENLKSKGLSFNSDEEGWDVVNNCLDACEFVSQADTDCSREHQGAANQREYTTCMTNVLVDYTNCEGNG
ncbi:MAG: hypothetical protein V1820_01205 [archaeon]